MRLLHNSIQNTLIIFFSITCLWSCGDKYGEPQPLDIIKGKEDLQQKYYKSILKNPAAVSGNVIDRKTQEPLGNVTITARLASTAVTYTTVTKDDGTFSLYVEGNLNYTFTGQKEGFDRTYYSTNYNNQIDTTFLVSSALSFNLALKTLDLTPTFKVNYISSVSLGLNTLSDLGFNGTNLVGINTYSPYVDYFNAAGIYIKSTNFQFDMDFFACNGTGSYWAADGYSLYNIDAKTGNATNTISYYLPSFGRDIEVYNGNLWMLGQTGVYKLSTNGTLLASIDLTQDTDVYNAIGITQKNNALYVLLLNNASELYLYKIDPATLTIQSKGSLSINGLNPSNLKGLSFDKTNFWTINTYAGALIKFNTVE